MSEPATHHRGAGPRPRLRPGHRPRPAQRGADPGQDRRARRADRRRLRRQGGPARRRPQGRGAVHERLRPGPAAAHPDGVHGRLVLRLGDQLLRRGPHPQGPRPRHRRQARPGPRGHHRLRADPVLAAEEPRRPAARVAGGLRPAAQARRGQGRGPGEVRRASTSPTSSSSATASTTPSATGTCPTSRRSSPRSTHLREERNGCVLAGAGRSPSDGCYASRSESQGVQQAPRCTFDHDDAAPGAGVPARVAGGVPGRSGGSTGRPASRRPASVYGT